LELLLDYVLIYRIVLIFMIGLISSCQVFHMLWVDFRQKFTCTLEKSSEYLKDDI